MADSTMGGPAHQQTVGENIPTERDLFVGAMSSSKLSEQEKPKREATTGEQENVSLGAGTETLVMLTGVDDTLASNGDPLLEDIMAQVRQQVVEFASGQLGADETQANLDEGLEDYKDTLLMLKDKIMKVISICSKTVAEAAKRISDRLGRMNIRMKYLTRQIELHKGDRPASKVDLPPTWPMLGIYGRVPANGAEVISTLIKTKNFFNNVHATYSGYQTSFQRAMQAVTREERLDYIGGYLNTLISKVSARTDSSVDGSYLVDALPGCYRMVIATGDSFTDSWVRLGRTEVPNNLDQTSLYPDKNTLERLITEVNSSLSTINELYGFVTSRLESDLKKAAKGMESAARSNGDEYDSRSGAATVTWYTDNQSTIFTRSMELFCATISACMDYCAACLRVKSEGNESLDLTSDVDMIDDSLECCRMADLNASVVATMVTPEIPLSPKEAVCVSEIEIASAEFRCSQSGILRQIFNTSRNNYTRKVAGQVIDLLNDLRGYEYITPFYRSLRTGVVSEPDLPARCFGPGLLGDMSEIQEGLHSRWLSIEDVDCISPDWVCRVSSRAKEQLQMVLDMIRKTVDGMRKTVLDSDINLDGLVDVLSKFNTNPTNDECFLSGGARVVFYSKPYGDKLLGGAVFEVNPISPVTSRTGEEECGEDIEALGTILSEFRAVGNEIADAHLEMVKLVNVADDIIRQLALGMADKDALECWVRSGYAYIALLSYGLRFVGELLINMALYRNAMVGGLTWYLLELQKVTEDDDPVQG